MHPYRLTPLLLAAVSLYAQDPAPLPPPAATEYYEPVPPVVTVPSTGIPSDALVLFDGKNLNAWEPVKADGKLWPLVNGALVVGPKAGDLRTKASFGNVQLHVEFATPSIVAGSGQGRGNSGVFLMGLYEVQVLDSWENPTYVNGQSASIYKQHPPLVNASRPPGEWQSYDIVFIAPRFNADGSLLSPARATVFHNGTLVQHDVELRGPTVWRGQPQYKAHPEELPLVLQDHGNPVSYRNLWIRRLK